MAKFDRDMAALGLVQPHSEPSATSAIAEILNLVDALMDKGLQSRFITEFFSRKGLLCQDDSHIFCAPSQLADELTRLLKFVLPDGFIRPRC